jgi:hypothetical protein
VSVEFWPLIEKAGTKMVKPYMLRVSNLGPIPQAEVEFGDLTVFVGPQASGKSVFLQTLKLTLDRNHIHDTLTHHNMVFRDDPHAFLGGYYGRGMGGMLDANPAPQITWSTKSLALSDLTKRGRRTRNDEVKSAEHLFYIPAQRVVSLPGGVSQPFTAFNYGDPYTLRYFADQVHRLLQNEFGSNDSLFPLPNRLNETLRSPISKHFFGGARLNVELKDFTKSITLKVDGLREGLPYLAWSAGQREFLPLLLGLYWLCTAGKVSRRDAIEWVVIEEPEMGLHPRAISAMLLMVLELMRRGYKVAISTHSPVVLDLVWALRTIIEQSGSEKDVRKLFELPSNDITKAIAGSTLDKKYKVYFFDRGKPALDISELDPGSDRREIAMWGDLLSFSSRTADVMSDVVARKNNLSGSAVD